MVVYIIMTVLAVTFSAMANIKKEKIKNRKDTKMIFWYLSEFVLIIVAAIRYDVGQDYMYTYVPYFNGILNGYVNSNIEIGFFVLNKIVQIFTRDYAGIFIVTSVIFFHYVYKAIREQSPLPTLSVFLIIGTTYYFVFLNTMRQLLTAAIFLYAIKFIKERNLLKYFIYMGIASTIHISAIILIPLYFIYNINLNPIKVTTITAVLMLAKPIISKVILNVISLTKYQYYVGSVFDIGESGFIVIAINVCILIFAMVYCYKDKKDLNLSKEYSFYVILQLLSVIVEWYNNVIPLFNRIRWSLGISVIVLIPMIIAREKNIKTRRFYSFIIVVLYSVYFLYTIGVKNSNNVLPYLTIFQRDFY